MTVIRFAFFCLIFAGGTGRGESSVWKVQKEESVMYLGGTCHMLRKSDFPLPEEFDQAYNASARLVLEVNMEEVNGAAFQRKLLARARYPDGETIKDHLSGEAYGALEAYCRTHHFPLGAFEQFKPSMLMITLSVMELVKHGVTLEGVDHYYDRKAQQNGMPRDALETADEQLEFILTMADGIEDETVLHTLRDLKTLKQDFDELIKAWRTGDEKMLDTLFLEEMKEEAPPMYEKLFVRRNQNWIPLLETYMQTPEIEFVLVGVGHMAGEEGVLNLLRKKGYTVRKL